MADPITALSLASTVAGGVSSAAGASTSADASASSFMYKAGIAKLNAQVDRQNAAWAINSGGIKSQEYGLKAGEEIANTKVTQAASGLDVNTGTNKVVRDAQGSAARFDQGTIMADAQHTAYGYQVKAASDTAEASMDTAAAENAKSAGPLGILSSLIGTAGSVASKWTQGSTIGMFSNSSGPIGTFDPNNYGAAPSWST